MPFYLTAQNSLIRNGMLDIANLKIGHLTALRPTDERKGGAVVWECRCDCEEENIVYRTTYQLRRLTRNLHCGCQDATAEKLKSGRIADVTNQTFGRLTALRPTDKRIGRAVIWECECSCGQKEIFRALDSLRDSGEQQSCGCWLSEISKENSKKNFHFVGGTRIESIKNQKLLKNNKSGVRGVHFDNKANKWRAVIYFQGKQIHLGLFLELNDAAKARQEAEDVYFKPIIEEFEATANAAQEEES